MRKLSAILLAAAGVLLISAPLYARDLLNEAAKTVADGAAERMVAETKEDIERVAVARFQNDPGNFTDLFKASVSKTKFDVILRDDTEWDKLLAEYERQMRHGDIMAPETVHKLEELGVDALVWGNVELAEVAPFQAEQTKGSRAEFRIIAKLSNLKGHLLWSDQVEAMAEENEALTPDERVSGWLEGRKLTALLIAGFGLVIVALIMVQRATTPR